jgi:hypothetical protein
MKEFANGIQAKEVAIYNANGDQVDPSTLSAGEAFAGKVGTPADLVDCTLVLDTAQYGSGDVLAITALLPNMARVIDGKINPWAIEVTDEDDQGQPFDLLFFRSNVSIGTINNAFSIDDAGSRDLLGFVRIAATDYEDWGGFRSAFVKVGDSGWKMGLCEPVTGARDLYVAAVSRGTGTYTTSGLKLKISVAQN